MFQKENITAPVFEEKNVENKSGSFIDRFGFQSSCEKHSKISKVAFNIGYITRKTISLPGKTKWTDFSKKLNFTPRLVNALGSEIVIVDTNNSIHIFDKKMNSFTNRYYEPMFHGEQALIHQYYTIGDQFQNIEANGEPIIRTHYEHDIQPMRCSYARYSNEEGNFSNFGKKGNTQKAINSIIVSPKNKFFIENSGGIYVQPLQQTLLNSRDFINLESQHLFGGFHFQKETEQEYPAQEFIFLVNRKDGKAVKYQISNWQKTELLQGLIDPVRILEYGNYPSQGHYIILLCCSSHKICIFRGDCDNYQLLYSFGEYGEGEGQLNHPYDVAVTHYGTLLVADTNNYRITEYSITGEFLRTLISFKRAREKVYSLSYNIEDKKLWVVLHGQQHRLLCCDLVYQDTAVTDMLVKLGIPQTVPSPYAVSKKF